MENLTHKEIDYAIAKERVKQLKNFYISVTVFIIAFTLYNFPKYYLTGKIAFLDFKNFSVIFWIWGIILLIKAIKLFVFNQSWERKVINKELNK